MRRALLALITLLVVAAPARAQITTDALLDTLQHTAFQYFWDTMNPTNGLMPDRASAGSPCSIASEGFGLTSICIAIDHGWVTRSNGRARVRTALETFWNLPQGAAASGTIGYQGFYYHFLDMNTGLRTWTSELSTIDTALLFAGVIDAKMYFNDANDTTETRIRALADSIYYRADWNFMRNGHAGLLMGWKPETGFAGYGGWSGYNEAMILYIEGLGSPTHALPSTAWPAWTTGYISSWGTQYGLTYLTFPPLFGHQYSHCWIDFRNIADPYMQSKGTDYFQNSVKATLAQRRYAIANPAHMIGYCDSLWGLTASDDPYSGYLAHGAPPAQSDNGTIVPTAPLGSIPFAPDSCIAVARNLWNNYRSIAWGPYGFVDAFNLTKSPTWYDTDWIGIDEGPIVIGIENYRTQRVWNRIMANVDIVRGLLAAGFIPTVSVEPLPAPPMAMLLPAAPNPFSSRTTLRFRLPQEARVRLAVFDLAGREVVRLVDGMLPAGEQAVTLDGGHLASGVYYLRLQAGDQVQVRKCVRLE